jgi:hypothetical protein
MGATASEISFVIGFTASDPRIGTAQGAPPVTDQ